ncbi:hypothetical protein SAMN02745134_00139 [Clostridium acidisoli DSM 12555]|uniref:Uncharacterized protein n=1 Tax=Clostridium acidisoli DSM 12555 TaxID=1121291 RepID=A0A1W1WYF4_9CLOT|nr:hypothetical protein [Clostridium acidisoli]SMC16695.1 hypothetical protein SAMN02745134_00139 [Clostridium acidisoli DSM 12555]
MYKDKKNQVNIKTDLLKDNSIILSDNVATRINAEKWDKIDIFSKITGNDESYIISKIVKADGETGQDMNVFGYALLNNSK